MATSSPPLDPAVSDQLAVTAAQHMQTQVLQVAQTQAGLRRLWQDTLDYADLAGSFTRFATGASLMIQAARSRGQITAQQFYQDSRLLAGIEGDFPLVDPVAQAPQADLTSLYATGYATAKRQTYQGIPPASALQAAEFAVMGAATRRILQAPRQRIIDLSEADPMAKAWARVGDGHPCYFCAMLIGRGPVYHSEQSASFAAHDHCGCSARPVWVNDPSHGWTADAKALNDAWYSADPGKPIGSMNNHTLASWRSAYKDIMADPSSPVRTALAQPPRAAFGLAA